MDDYNNPRRHQAAQNINTGHATSNTPGPPVNASSMARNTGAGAPPRRRPNRSHGIHGSGQQQHQVDANYNGYGGYHMGNNPNMYLGMEPQIQNILYGPNPYSSPAALANPIPGLQVNNAPVNMGNLGGQARRQSLRRQSQMLAQPHAMQAYSPNQCAPAGYEPSHDGRDEIFYNTDASAGHNIHEAYGGSVASRQALGATTVGAARSSRQARRQGIAKTSQPTKSHDVPDSNTNEDCNDEDYDDDEDEDHKNDKDGKTMKSNIDYDGEDGKLQSSSPDGKKKLDEKGRGEKVRRPDAKVSNARRDKKNNEACTKPENVYQNFQEYLHENGMTKHFCETKILGELRFQYNHDGQLKDRYFSSEEIRTYVEHQSKNCVPYTGKSPNDPTTHMFTMWLQSPPCQSKGRMKGTYNNTCRWEHCPSSKGKIEPGWFRVAFDEHPKATSDGTIDPLKPVLCLHLWCFEKIFSRSEMRKFLKGGYLKGDVRNPLGREDRSLVTLERDSRKDSSDVIKGWQDEEDEEALLKKCDELVNRKVDAGDDNNEPLGRRVERRRRHRNEHLLSLSCRLTLWQSGTTRQPGSMLSKGTRQKCREKRNEDVPEGLRTTLDYNLGDLEAYIVITDLKTKWTKTVYGGLEYWEGKEKLHQGQLNMCKEKLEKAVVREKDEKKYNDAKEKYQKAKGKHEKAEKDCETAENNFVKVEEQATKHTEPGRGVANRRATEAKGNKRGAVEETNEDVQDAKRRRDRARRDLVKAEKEKDAAEKKQKEAAEPIEKAKENRKSLKVKIEKYTRQLEAARQKKEAIQKRLDGDTKVQTKEEIEILRGIDKAIEELEKEPAGESSKPPSIDAGYESTSSEQLHKKETGTRKKNGTRTRTTARQGSKNSPVVITSSPSPCTSGNGEQEEEESASSPGATSEGRSSGRPLSGTNLLKIEAWEGWVPGSPIMVDGKPPSPSMMLGPNSPSLGQSIYTATPPDVASTPKARAPQGRVLEEAPDPDEYEDEPCRIKQEPGAASRKRGLRELPDYNDTEEPPRAKRARIAAPRQSSGGTDRPTRRKRRPDDDAAGEHPQKRVRQ